MYFLPLQAGLRPVMKSFILALLPGLEEETGEFFDKVCSASSLFASSHMNCGPGPRSPRSLVWNGLSFLLPTEYLARHAHNALRSRNVTELPVTSITPPQW